MAVLLEFEVKVDPAIPVHYRPQAEQVMFRVVQDPVTQQISVEARSYDTGWSSFGALGGETVARMLRGAYEAGKRDRGLEIGLQIREWLDDQPDSYREYCEFVEDLWVALAKNP